TQAAVLKLGVILTINTGIASYNEYGNYIGVSNGSWFAVDFNLDHKITSSEKVPISQGLTGIVIGDIQDPGEITAPYDFYGATAQEFTNSPVTGSVAGGLDFSGWSWLWADVSAPFGSGAWTPLNCEALGVPCSGYTDGVALFSWSGNYGDSYQLNYALTIPEGDPSGLGGIQYFY